MVSTAYLHRIVHITTCLKQHPDRLQVPFLAGNVQRGSPMLQHIPTETDHGPLHRSATPRRHTRNHCS